MDELGECGDGCGEPGADGAVDEDAARWQERLKQRLAGLRPGRYTITLTVTKHGCDWSIGERQKVER
jgi:hypothetical protein